MANLTASDEDELIELEEAKASDATPSKDELMMNILTQMSVNLNTASESLKHLHQSNWTLRTPRRSARMKPSPKNWLT